MSLPEPERVESGSVEALRFIAKVPVADAFIAVRAKKTVRPLLLARTFGDELRIEVQASAHAFGGSLSDFAQKTTDSIEAAEALLDAHQADRLYRAALLPEGDVE